MKFKLHGKTIEFNEAQCDELRIFRKIYYEINNIIDKEYKQKFIDYIFIPRKKSDYIDEEDLFYDIEDELKELFVSTCSGIEEVVVDYLLENEVYGFERKAITQAVQIYLETAFELSYMANSHNVDNKIVSNLKAYNRMLQNNFLERLLYFSSLSFWVADSITSDILDEIHLDKNPHIDKETFNLNLSSFIEEAHNPVLINNKIRFVRENIEAKGVTDEKLLTKYVSTFEQDPFSIKSYFYLVKTLGDKNSEVNSLCNFIFGTDIILENYKNILVKRELIARLPKNYPKFDNLKEISRIEDLSKLKYIKSEITDIRSYYGAKYSSVLEIEIDNRISLLEKQIEESKNDEYIVEEPIKEILPTVCEKEIVDESSEFSLDEYEVDGGIKPETSNSELKYSAVSYKENVSACNYNILTEVNDEKINKERFYTKTWFVIMLLFLFWPVGVYLMWRYSKFNKGIRIIITAVLAINIIINFI